MTPHFRLSVGRSVCHDFLKGREVSLPCVYWSISNKALVQIFYNRKKTFSPGRWSQGRTENGEEEVVNIHILNMQNISKINHFLHSSLCTSIVSHQGQSFSTTSLLMSSYCVRPYVCTFKEVKLLICLFFFLQSCY